MSIETIRELQAYGYVLLIVCLCVGLYSYFYHLYKSEKTGRRNYEKYGKLALDDDIEDEIIEPISSKSKDSLQEELKK